MEIDIKKLTDEAVKHMQAENDLRWSIGMALQELYWDEFVREMQTQMVDKFNNQGEVNHENV
jgi:hypothetical protein